MKRSILAVFLGMAMLRAGSARGEVYFAMGGIPHDGTLEMFQGYPTPTLVRTESDGMGLINSTQFVMMADFNGDGYPDVATSSYTGGIMGSFPVRIKDGKTWTNMATIPLCDESGGIPYSSGAPIAAADVNGDGVLDVIVGPNSRVDAPLQGSTKIRVFSGSDWSQLPQTYTANGIRVASADFNHDGHADIITNGTVYNGANSNVLFTFPAANNYDFGHGLAAGDVNGDGTPDIVVADSEGMITAYSGVNQQVLLQASASTFTGGAVPLYQWTMTLADMNQDGVSDFVFNTGAKLSVVSGADHSIFTQNLQTVVNTGAGEIAAWAPSVPEAGTLGALVCGAVVLLKRRR